MQATSSSQGNQVYVDMAKEAAMHPLPNIPATAGDGQAINRIMEIMSTIQSDFKALQEENALLKNRITLLEAQQSKTQKKLKTLRDEYDDHGHYTGFDLSYGPEEAKTDNPYYTSPGSD